MDEKLKQQLAERKEIRSRGKGRPKKTEVAAKKTPGTLGRPKGNAAIINDYTARMLASPKSKFVLETIFDAALDNEHKNQAAAWKLVMDRILPVAAFEKDVIKDVGRNAIQINITGVGTASVASGDTNDYIGSTLDGDTGEIL